MADQKQHEFVERLEARRERYNERGLAYRVMWVLAGVAILLVGIALLVLPGPGIVLIVIGLGMISFEVDWAARLLERGLEEGFDAKDALEKASPAVQAAAGLASLVLLAGVVWLTYAVVL